MKKESRIGNIKHTDPNFWRFALAYLLLCCGCIVIVDGVIRWAMDEANSSIPVGCFAIIFGIIVLPGKKTASGETDQESPSDESELNDE